MKALCNLLYQSDHQAVFASPAMFTMGHGFEAADRWDAVCSMPNHSILVIHGLHSDVTREDLRSELSMLSRHDPSYKALNRIFFTISVSARTMKV